MKLSPYQADATSYDYDTAISEAGDPTEKFFTLQVRTHVVWRTNKEERERAREREREREGKGKRDEEDQ